MVGVVGGCIERRDCARMPGKYINLGKRNWLCLSLRIDYL